MKKFFGVLCFLGLALILILSPAYGDQPWYYNQLNAFQKELYSFELSLPHETDEYTFVSTVDLSQYSEEEIYEYAYDTFWACDLDNPMGTRWNNTCIVKEVDISSNSIVVYAVKNEYYDEEDDGRIEEILQAIVDSADMSWDDYTKASYIASTITSCMTYDLNYVFYSSNSKMNEDKQHITGILNGTAVCEGYSELFKELADRLGLTCVEVSSLEHAFIHIQMEDGQWYGHDPQNDLRLEGQSMSSITWSKSGEFEYDMYELYNGIFYYITQPCRTEEDYVYAGQVPAQEIVDVDEIKKSQHMGDSLFTYTVNDDGTTCTVTGNAGGQSGNLAIPETIDGYTVTAIANSAFAYSEYFNGSLILPDTVEEVGAGAFAFCSGLKGDLILPRDLKTIRDSAFISCDGFDGAIYFNSVLETIEAGAFTNCRNIRGDLILPDSITSIGTAAFYNCQHLDGTLHIPLNIQEWSPGFVDSCSFSTIDVSKNHQLYTVSGNMLLSKDKTVFVQCPNAYSGNVTIPEGVERVGTCAFYMCKNVQSVLFPSTLKSIGKWAFGYTTGIRTHDLVLPESIQEIEANAFYCTGYTGTLYYPAIDNVGYAAFGANQKISRAIIPDGVTTLPLNCFEFMFCTEIYLPDTLTSLSSDFFRTWPSNVIVYGHTGGFAEQYANQVNSASSWQHFEFRPTDNYWQEEVYYYLEAEETHYPGSIMLTVQNTDTNEPVHLTGWKSSDSTIAAVNSSGRAVAIGIGIATIEARTDGGIPYSWTIFCCRFPTSMVMVRDGRTIETPGPNDITTAQVGEYIYVEVGYPGECVLPNPEYSNYTECTRISSNPGVIKIVGNKLRAMKKGASVITFSNRTGMSVSAIFLVTDGTLSIPQATLTLPVGLNVIDSEAFSGIRAVIVEIPDGVTKINSKAFSDCRHLGVVRIPDSVTFIASDAFSGSTGVVIRGRRGSYAETYAGSHGISFFVDN